MIWEKPKENNCEISTILNGSHIEQNRSTYEPFFYYYTFMSVIAGILISFTQETGDKLITHWTMATISCTGIRVPSYNLIAFSAPSSKGTSAASSPGLNTLQRSYLFSHARVKPS